MPHYRPGATEDDFDALRAFALAFAANSEPFHANDLLSAALQQGVTTNAGDVAAILQDLADLDELEHLQEPNLWQLPESH